MNQRCETFTTPGYQAVHVRQLADGRIVVTGATIAPASPNGLRLVPQPKPLPQP
jgi:hypothetical protein